MLEKEVEEYYIIMNQRKNIIDIFYLFYEYVFSLFLEYFINLKKIEIRKANSNMDFQYKYDYEIERLRYNEILPVKVLDYYFHFEYFKNDKRLLPLYLNILKIIKNLDELLIKIKQENNLKNYEDKLEFIIKDILSVFVENINLEKIEKYTNILGEEKEKMKSKNILDIVPVENNYI